jgi:hypothetical protein
MRETKKKQMAEELTEFNEKTKTQDGLYEELRKMDEMKKMPNAAEDAEMEKRRAILKGVKKQIDTDDAFKPKVVRKVVQESVKASNEVAG